MKYSVWLVWCGSVAAILLGAGWVSIAGHLALWLTLAAHFAEFLVKRDVMEKAGGSMAHHFLQTMLYGLFHWKPLEDAQRR
jgi:hypothetical protein